MAVNVTFSWALVISLNVSVDDAAPPAAALPKPDTLPPAPPIAVCARISVPPCVEPLTAFTSVLPTAGPASDVPAPPSPAVCSTDAVAVPALPVTACAVEPEVNPPIPPVTPPSPPFPPVAVTVATEFPDVVVATALVFETFPPVPPTIVPSPPAPPVMFAVAVAFPGAAFSVTV
jgi:hypothetical protein